MKIAVIGVGYVGLVTGTCLAELGNDVTCADINQKKIDKLNKGEIFLYEIGLRELFDRNTKAERLSFTSDVDSAIQEADVVFIAVWTPEDVDGSADLTAVMAVAETIGKNMTDYKLIVDKSTVPVGTADKVRAQIQKHYQGDFSVASNPEFLREGSAVRDFLVPDRIVIGVDSKKAEQMLTKIYSNIARQSNPIITVDIKTAEMIKYASNAFLATKISFMNELARLCEKVNADVKSVASGMGLDSRIGSKFLQAGIGFGGSCFPKDVAALAKTGEENGVTLSLLNDVLKINQDQRTFYLDKLLDIIPDVEGKKIAVWGLSFKPKTNDVRCAPALDIIEMLMKKGANVSAFDPEGMEEFKEAFNEPKNGSLTYGQNQNEVIEDADALLLLTEWDEFRSVDFSDMKKAMKSPILIDGRNIYNKDELKEVGFTYRCIGREGIN